MTSLIWVVIWAWRWVFISWVSSRIISSVLSVAVVMAVYTLVRHFTGNTVSGWSSLMISIWFLGGLNLLALGVVGEYIGKIYSEVKQRPRYIVEETVGLDQ